MPARFWQYLFVQSLTLGRIPLILIFLLVTLFVNTREHPVWFGVAFYSMILSAVTDAFDGYFARKFNVTSRLGAYADPLADKIFYLTTFPTLVYLAGQYEPPNLFHTRLLVATAIFYLMRDQWVSFLRYVGALYGADASANWVGKMRTILSFPIICVIYYYLQAPRNWRLQLPINLIYVLEWVLLAVNLISIYSYTARYWPWIRKELQPSGEGGGKGSTGLED